MTELSRRDASSPFAEEKTSSGVDVESITGLELVRQRIKRLLFTAPGELRHRPDFGVGLQTYRNEPITPANRTAMINDAQEGLDVLDFVQDYKVSVGQDETLFHFRLHAQTDEGELFIEEKI